MQKKLSSVLYITLIVVLTSAFIIQGAGIFINAYDEHLTSAQYQAEAICKEFDNELNYYLDISLNIITNPLIIELLQFDEDYSMQDAFDDITFVGKYFSSFKEIENYMPDQMCIYANNYFPIENAYIYNISDLQKKKAWGQIKNAKNYAFVWEYGGTTPDDMYLSLYGQIFKSTESLGWLEIKIPYEKIIYSFENVPLNEFNTVVLNSFGGTHIYSSSDEVSGRKIELTAINGDKILFYIDMHKAMLDTYNIMVWLIIIYIIFLIGVKFVSKKIITKTTKELGDFIQMIRSDDNLLYNSELIDVNGDDEIVQIKKKFKELIARNNQLHETVEKANSEKQHAELNFLQYSINPHLLYNSLSCIKWCIMEKSEDEISDIIDNLTSYYRIALSSGENFITIEEELKLIERYVNIMEIIYGTSISLEFDVQPDLKNTYTIKMLLQPIVENSILHGLNGVDNAKISISVQGSGDDVVITVRDNGYGMNEETINNLLKGENGRKQKGYGVHSVIKRISCYYGAPGRVDVVSEINSGTEITIHIKKISDLSEIK
ncbi:MAG: histidine kinase [Clostridia bacterium]|nr:histidine kinase [Clostridia bacterium]